MPGCRDCKWLLKSNQCGIAHPHPLRNCVTAIMLEYAELLKPGQTILEVGCGAWSPLKEKAGSVGCLWEGIDVNRSYQGQPTIATRIASVAEIPFVSENFDFVVATQSMEHWEEYRVDLHKGLSEVFRVLKPGGWALMNVPIYFHGGTRFVLGDVPGVRRLFEPFSDVIQMEAWRYPPEPLPTYRYHLKYYWHKPKLWSKSSYVLDIRAQRKEKVPYFERIPISTFRKIKSGLMHRGVLFYISLFTFTFLGKVFRDLRNGAHQIQ